MRYPRLISRITSSIWCIRDEALQAVLDTLSLRLRSDMPLVPDPTSAPDDSPEMCDPGDAAPQGVSVVCVQGIIGKYLSAMETMCGGCDLACVEAQLEDAFSNPSIYAIVLAIDSPGGIVAGTPELYDKIVALRAATGKKIYAVIEQEGCSAGYYLAAACDRIYTTQAAIVGNVGTKIVFRELTAANAAAGVKFHVFKSGAMKDIGAPYRAPTAEEEKFLQTQAEILGEKFREDILAQRPAISAADLEGQPFLGSQALAAGLVDEIVTDLDDLFAQLAPLAPALP